MLCRLFFTIAIIIFSLNAYTISIDKMIAFAGDKITVKNDSDFAVFIKVDLSELNLKTGVETPLNKMVFTKWPVYADRYSFVIDPESSEQLNLTPIDSELGKQTQYDRIVGVSFVPESYKDNDKKSQYKLSMLIGFKTWYIIPNQKKTVEGDVSIQKTIKVGEYIFNNNTDTVVEFDVNTCKTKQHPKQCEETIIALAHRHKKITLEGVTGGTIKVIARDKRNRFKKSLIIDTANSLQKSTTG